MTTKYKPTMKKPTSQKRKKDEAILFVNSDGHALRLSKNMKLSELIKLGVVEIRLIEKR